MVSTPYLGGFIPFGNARNLNTPHIIYIYFPLLVELTWIVSVIT